MSESTLTTVLPGVQALSHADKLRLTQMLVLEVARNDGVALFEAGASYPVWTPFHAEEAGESLLRLLQAKESSQ